MNIGILMTATAQSGDLAAYARKVESLGFDSLWIPEHPVIPVGHKTPFPIGDGKLPEHYNRWADPFIALTVAAAVTNTIKLGTAICLLPEREPLMTAKVIATLDHYSGGRVIIGAGAGWLREETEVMGASFRLRWKRMREIVEAMRVLWTKAEASYEGETVRFPAVRCEPKPVQKNGPPILLGAHGPQALERVARTYDGWLPLVHDPAQFKKEFAEIRQRARAFGRDPDALHCTTIVEPSENGPSVDDLKRYRDAGAQRVIVFSQRMGTEIADGKGTEWITRVAPVVERGQHV
ncbi:MAG: LLM class F420-dependent oxidoreductase [Deltaproteobacteria bacterium]|nr:LLM class F420-dependent oxidoreductase [Deltaproteobacteria bacterium]